MDENKSLILACSYVLLLQQPIGPRNVPYHVQNIQPLLSVKPHSQEK